MVNMNWRGRKMQTKIFFHVSSKPVGPFSGKELLNNYNISHFKEGVFSLDSMWRKAYSHISFAWYHSPGPTLLAMLRWEPSSGVIVNQPRSWSSKLPLPQENVRCFDGLSPVLLIRAELGVTLLWEVQMVPKLVGPISKGVLFRPEHVFTLSLLIHLDCPRL